MNVHISYKLSKNSNVEREINLQIQKVRKRLQVFRPELVHLHAILEDQPARAGILVRLDLRLPSGDIATSNSAPTVTTAIKSAFDDLIQQITRHKARLRNHRQWPRRQKEGRAPEQVPFESTLAAVQAPKVSDEDISGYVNANLSRLQRFVERELRYRESLGELTPFQLRSEEVIDEAIANALSDGEKPEKLALEAWIYRLAVRAMNELPRRQRDSVDAVSLEEHPRRPQEELERHSDEAYVEFHQPDETITEENLIPNRSAASPEDTVASDEMLNLVERALRGTRREDREAFLLFGIEGFNVEEISAISGRSSQDVRHSINSAREHLRRNLSDPGQLRNKTFQQPRPV
ncbi:MAG TPA: HPF/RaiA family ribosome-associated protein [Terriglobales bacterium]|nr:HPF/RaiA family ribosome-associated protein [Terriglobales bacterium]